MIGLGLNATKNPTVKKTIVRDGLVLRHDYKDRPVELVSSGAASFNGSSDHIDVGDSNNFVTGNNVTMACWFRLLGDDAGQYLISNQRSSGGSNISIRLNSNGAVNTAGYVSLVLWSGSSIGYVNYDGNVDTSNQWHHIAVTTTSGAQKIYLDGIDVASGTLTFANAASTDHTTLGAHNLSSAGDFKGYMANVGIWNAALTQPQIKSIMHKDYAALSASEKTDLVSWWNLDEETATDGTAGTGGVKDHKGSNHGTLA